MNWVFVIFLYVRGSEDGWSWGWWEVLYNLPRIWTRNGNETNRGGQERLLLNRGAKPIYWSSIIFLVACQSLIRYLRCSTLFTTSLSEPVQLRGFLRRPREADAEPWIKWCECVWTRNSCWCIKQGGLVQVFFNCALYKLMMAFAFGWRDRR